MLDRSRMPGCRAMAGNERTLAANAYAATGAKMSATTGLQILQTMLTDVENIPGTVCDGANNLAARPRAAKSDLALHNDAPVCWNTRNIDMAGLRQWFLRRVAQEALKELQQEEQHVQHER
jgi:hypothetical protein